jgi:hypothetical protein
MLGGAAESGVFNTFMGEFNFSDLRESDLMRSIRLFGEKGNSGLARVRTVLMPSDLAITRWHPPTPDEAPTTYREPVPEG